MSTPENKDQPKNKFALWLRSLPTAIAFAKFVAAPFERARLLLQTQAWLLATGRIDRPYTGLIDCMQRIIDEEGFIYLWRGSLWGVARYFAATYIEYRLNDVFEVFFSELFHSSWLAIRALPFAIKSMFSTAVIAPLDALRTLEAIDIGGRTYTYPWEIILQSWRKSYLTSLWSGFAVAALQQYLYHLICIPLRDKRRLLPEAWLKNPFTSYLTKGYSTLIAIAALQPIDTVRRMETVIGLESDGRTPIEVIKDIYQRDGVLGFFEGTLANLLLYAISSIPWLLAELKIVLV